MCPIGLPYYTADVSQSENKAFQEKLETAQQGAVQATAKLNELQRTFEVEQTAWTNDKKTLEETIIDLSTSEKHSESDRTSREQEVRLQEERAKVYLLIPVIFFHTYFPQRPLRSAIRMSWLHTPNLGRLSKL